MHIARTTFDNAQSDTGLGGALVIGMIAQALAMGESVIIRKAERSESLLQPGELGKYKTKPIPMAKA